MRQSPVNLSLIQGNFARQLKCIYLSCHPTPLLDVIFTPLSPPRTHQRQPPYPTFSSLSSSSRKSLRAPSTSTWIRSPRAKQTLTSYSLIHPNIDDSLFLILLGGRSFYFQNRHLLTMLASCSLVLGFSSAVLTM